MLREEVPHLVTYNGGVLQNKTFVQYKYTLVNYDDDVSASTTYNVGKL